ncbi:hypothetical protein BABINDRAFT_160358 [Babjeviella inositovora NRRL Y-12698]|uniref:SMP-30/Gluconolactonase/LRE-like region domain-containing protein n=1 Tax=Babjeviella inositovora NRRL Y-12698 TaxID=984486 RepID=A0A1E3QVC1_9ASCO|nr:uncharacterized protein BABINDRAFT_160358 [Babjeviella inositovora NRRL Y-12698]ODQ80917.1 hypothetical protein BABINDRAFT_160358 [Babjeviella inositovora NRRL Y-12698]
MVKSTTVSAPFLNLDNLLAEGPIYNPAINTIYWIDAIGSKIHRVKLLDNSNEITDYSSKQIKEVMKSHQVISCNGEIVGSVGLTDNNDVLALAWTKGFGFANFKTLEFVVKGHFPIFNPDPELRLNDGIIDNEGNFWVGAMDKHIGSIASGKSKLFRVNKDLSVDKILDDVQLSNGINFYTDKSGKQSLFYTDTLTLTLWKFDYDPATGQVSNRTPHIVITDHFPKESLPGLDGFSLTEDGHIYTAVWGLNRVCHFDENAKLVEEFVFPAARVSSCSFMGPERNELFVTTASSKLPAEDGVKDTDEDLGGACFRIKLDGVKGQLKDAKWGGKIDV